MKKILNLLSSMLVLSGSSMVTVACDNDKVSSSDIKNGKSYLDWMHNEVKCNPDEEIYLSEWGYDKPDGAILYCTIGEKEDIRQKSSKQFSVDIDEYNIDWTVPYTILPIGDKIGIKWNGKYPKGYFKERWEFDKYERNFRVKK